MHFTGSLEAEREHHNMTDQTPWLQLYFSTQLACGYYSRAVSLSFSICVGAATNIQQDIGTFFSSEGEYDIDSFKIEEDEG